MGRARGQNQAATERGFAVLGRYRKYDNLRDIVSRRDMGEQPTSKDRERLIVDYQEALEASERNAASPRQEEIFLPRLSESFPPGDTFNVTLDSTYSPLKKLPLDELRSMVAHQIYFTEDPRRILDDLQYGKNQRDWSPFQRAHMYAQAFIITFQNYLKGYGKGSSMLKSLSEATPAEIFIQDLSNNLRGADCLAYCRLIITANNPNTIKIGIEALDDLNAEEQTLVSSMPSAIADNIIAHNQAHLQSFISSLREDNLPSIRQDLIDGLEIELPKAAQYYQATYFNLIFTANSEWNRTVTDTLYLQDVAPNPNEALLAVLVRDRWSQNWITAYKNTHPEHRFELSEQDWRTAISEALSRRTPERSLSIMLQKILDPDQYELGLQSFEDSATT